MTSVKVDNHFDAKTRKSNEQSLRRLKLFSRPWNELGFGLNRESGTCDLCRSQTGLSLHVSECPSVSVKDCFVDPRTGANRSIIGGYPHCGSLLGSVTSLGRLDDDDTSPSFP